jgi:hypothetical protein
MLFGTGLRASSVFSVPLWLMLMGKAHHGDTENTNDAQRNTEVRTCYYCNWSLS